MNAIPLRGCRPTPLASYLSALGALRLVASQADPEARGAWDGETFTLHTRLSEAEVTAFFLTDYAPTPILAPWNGGSGFYPKDSDAALLAIEASPAPRLAPLRGAIAATRAVLEDLALKEKPDKEAKATLLEACRGALPDDALPWLDAAFVLTGDGAKYPPLLGTGGNDGRLEFTNNLMQRICEVMDPGTGAPTASSEPWLRLALFGDAADGLQRSSPIGQFSPGAAGGANTSAGFDGEAQVCPWQFILMLEGALLFAASAVRRLGGAGPGALSYPFAVRQTPEGYGSAAASDRGASRAEMWLPLWEAPATLSTLTALIGEGRASLGRRPAADGVDFARAVATLGVDRGITAFARYGFQARNGRSYFATSLGRFQVTREPRADLLLEVDRWLRSVRGRGESANAPASVLRAGRALERAILALCRSGGPSRLEAVLIGLGGLQRALSQSLSWTRDAFLAPLPPLSMGWLEGLGAPSVELRLAASLASTRRDPAAPPLPRGVPGTWLVEHLGPILRGPRGLSWRDGADNEAVWAEGDVLGSLRRILDRRLLKARAQGDGCLPDVGWAAPLGDVAALIDGRVDLRRLEGLLFALVSLGFTSPPAGWAEGAEADATPALYGALKLCLPPAPLGDPPIPLDPALLRLAAAGRGADASRIALRRLWGAGFTSPLRVLPCSGDAAQRIASALVFPISPAARERLTRALSREAGRDAAAPADP